jgi:hypothetical protein
MERAKRRPRAGFSLSAILQEHPSWIADKKVAVLAQPGAERERDFPDVALMHELAKPLQRRRIRRSRSSMSVVWCWCGRTDTWPGGPMICRPIRSRLPIESAAPMKPRLELRPRPTRRRSGADGGAWSEHAERRSRSTLKLHVNWEKRKLSFC